MTLVDDGSEPRPFGKEVETIFYSRYIANGETKRIAAQARRKGPGAHEATRTQQISKTF